MKELTGIKDKNGIPITEDCWIECDDENFKTRSPHYVFWDDDCLCWSTIKFCVSNRRLDYKDELFRVKHSNPVVIERPQWATNERMYSQLKYHNSEWANAQGPPPKQKQHDDSISQSLPQKV